MRAQIQLIPCGGGQIWPLLKIEVPDAQKWSKSGILIFLANFQVILNNFCFYGNVEKIIFGPLLYDQKPIFAPNIGWPCGGGGQIWPFLKIDFQDPKNGPKSDFSAFSAKQKLLEI